MDRFGHLLIDPPLNPALNMAVDWWLLKTVDRPTIRFYRWDQPVISLGYRQQTSFPPELSDATDRFPLVVRPTGGGFLYHHRDLSYSIVLPANHDLTDQSILESYESIREVFGSVLKELGVLENRKTGQGSSLNENCLASAAGHEPVTEGAKWMAASQLRHRGRLLQHGSLFWEDPDWPEAFNDIKPFHLGQIVDDLTLANLREALIERLTRQLLPGPKLILKQRTRSDWNRLLELTLDFDVAVPEQLPVFDRYDNNRE